MNTTDAADALQAHEEARQRRHAQGYPPMPPRPLGEVWRPELTEQDRQAQEQRIQEHQLPF